MLEMLIKHLVKYVLQPHTLLGFIINSRALSLLEISSVNVSPPCSSFQLLFIQVDLMVLSQRVQPQWGQPDDALEHGGYLRSHPVEGEGGDCGGHVGYQVPKHCRGDSDRGLQKGTFQAVCRQVSAVSLLMEMNKCFLPKCSTLNLKVPYFREWDFMSFVIRALSPQRNAHCVQKLLLAC